MLVEFCLICMKGLIIKINLFKRIADTIDFYLQCELRNLREQESELNKEQVLTLIEQAQILGELQGLLKVGK